MFSCEFCEISMNTFLIEHLWTTASTVSKLCFADKKSTKELYYITKVKHKNRFWLKIYALVNKNCQR